VEGTGYKALGVAGGASMISGQTGLGFNPFHAVANVAKKAGHGIVVGTKATGRGIATGAKATAHVAVGAGKLALVPVKELEKHVLGPLLRLALRPVKSQVQKLVTRRARKLAMDRRKSTTPTPAETQEAKVWARNRLKGEKPPFGRILAMLV
jgi:hypothetical protein